MLEMDAVSLENSCCTNDLPSAILETNARQWRTEITSRRFAEQMDERDPMKKHVDAFVCPQNKSLPGVDLSLVDGEERCVYMCCNSLGLQPRGLKKLMDEQIEKWRLMGVHGHREGALPWALADECLDEDMANVVGAKRQEVVLMNGLTVNLHLMMVSFYRPTPSRHKIILEKHAFPSDHYAVESQIRFHGYDVEKSIIYWEPKKGEELLDEKDIFDRIDYEGDSIAMILLPGVQYYTGQLINMRTITTRAQKKGIYVGVDLAHAVGNVDIKLHDWNVDFAVWCTYKYLSSGAGGIGGAFIHERHNDNNFPKFLGWWGHKLESRFKMDNELELDEGIRGYRISNPSMFMCAALRSSLDVYKQVSRSDYRLKSRLLTGYLEQLLERHLAYNENNCPWVRIITPRDPNQRGCQLSIMVSVPVMDAFKELVKHGAVVDVREPNVIRVAPTPVHNTFTDVHKFVVLLCKVLKVPINQ